MEGQMKNSKPTKYPMAVLISDIHYRVDTLELADSALNQAVEKAYRLKVPLIICGDLNDTKAIIRGECANRLISTLTTAKGKCVNVYILVGNHDLLNEKSKQHSLEFLRPYATVVDKPYIYRELIFNNSALLIPYVSDPETFRAIIKLSTIDNLIIMHQGVKGADMGNYVLDNSSVDPEEVKRFKCFSGHYHKHQTVGTVTYVGNPYTLTFAEAKDGPKGFQVLNSDYTLDFVPTNLRKHVVQECTTDEVMTPIDGLNKEDLLWLKVKGPYSELEKLNKKKIGMKHLGHSSFKLDLISTDEVEVKSQQTSKMSNVEIMDFIVDSSDELSEQKTSLKSLWREVMK